MSKEDEIKDQKEHNTQAHTPLCSRKAPGCKNDKKKERNKHTFSSTPLHHTNLHLSNHETT